VREEFFKNSSDGLETLRNSDIHPCQRNEVHKKMKDVASRQDPRSLEPIWMQLRSKLWVGVEDYCLLVCNAVLSGRSLPTCASCHRHQGDEVQYTSTRLHGATTQKTAVFILAVVRTTNPTYGQLLEIVDKMCESNGTKLICCCEVKRQFVLPVCSDISSQRSGDGGSEHL
jgi:hypothetical protein